MNAEQTGKGKRDKGKWKIPRLACSRVFHLPVSNLDFPIFRLRVPRAALPIFYFLFSIFCTSAGAQARQSEGGQAPIGQPPVGDEVVANLAAGRVVIYVARDAIVIGLYENRCEPETRPPVVVPLSGRRVGILLGAVDWQLADSRTSLLRLDQQLPRLVSEVTGMKRLQQEQDSDLEAIGMAMLEPLRAAVERLHHKLAVGPEDPIVELLLVGYLEEYGPEIWSLRYRIVQEPLRTDFWRTRILRPQYTQLYPPEKGEPRTLVEFRYPPEDKSPTMLELLARDPRLARLRTGDLQMTRAVQQLDKGESHKALADDAAVFVQAALNAIIEKDTALGVGLIRERGGFEWRLAPPQRAEKAEEEKREPGAPTLRKKPPE